MLPLRWTEHAVAHLEAIVEYISLTSPVYAEAVLLRIVHRLQLVRTHPQIGKRAPETSEDSIREVIVPPYRIFYRHEHDCIEVLAIVHERRNLPDAL